MKKIKHIFFIIFGLAFLGIISYLYAISDLSIKEILDKAIERTAQDYSLIILLTLAIIQFLLSINTIFLNLKLLFSTENKSQKYLIENIILPKSKTSKHLVNTSIILNVFYGFITFFTPLTIIILILNDYLNHNYKLHHDDITFISALSFVSIIGLFIIAQSVKIFNKLKY